MKTHLYKTVANDCFSFFLSACSVHLTRLLMSSRSLFNMKPGMMLLQLYFAFRLGIETQNMKSFGNSS